jgi:malonate-semialdehyde dehydrogenase (acetylating)/methylmalonate-semialdehyde dehydrogenase
MFDFCHLIKKNSEELANMITLEHGKTLPDSRGDV